MAHPAGFSEHTRPLDTPRRGTAPAIRPSDPPQRSVTHIRHGNPLPRTGPPARGPRDPRRPSGRGSSRAPRPSRLAGRPFDAAQSVFARPSLGAFAGVFVGPSLGTSAGSSLAPRRVGGGRARPERRSRELSNSLGLPPTQSQLFHGVWPRMCVICEHQMQTWLSKTVFKPVILSEVKVNSN